MKTYTKVKEIVSHSSGRTYIISKDENEQLSCNCPAWIFKARRDLHGDNRFCKHIEQYCQNVV